ncbi:MAG: ATP-dependent Clp protease proteolytic subunit [Wenzhouxiangella sp.]|jgi:hypothetical protein|nr:ATP-dependent Clp protease proteolytic subunit [Wenzhouxiangella sp.]
MDKQSTPLELRGQVGADFDQLDVAFGLSRQQAPAEILLASQGGAGSIGTLIAQQVAGCRIRAEFAESAAVAILVAGGERELASDGWLFVHRAWSVETGNAEHMRACADYLDGLDRHMAETLAPRTNLDVEEVLDLIQREITITPDLALAWGFIDRIGEPAGLEPRKERSPEVTREAESLSMVGMQLAVAEPGGKLNGLQNHAAHVAGESDEGYRAVESKREQRPSVVKGAGLERAVSIWNGAFAAAWRRLQSVKAGQAPGNRFEGRWQCARCNAISFIPAEVHGRSTPCHNCGSTE